MQYLTYALQQGSSINRFLISEIHTQPVKGDAVVIEKQANVWEGSVGAASHINPVREVFVQKRRQAVEPYPIFTDKVVDGSVLIGGKPRRLSAWFPFNDPVLSLSGFYPNPAWIRATAITFLEASRPMDVACELAVCGGARIWVNQQLVAVFTPHLRNQIQRTNISLPLFGGVNELVVLLDEFAERDSDCLFSLTPDSKPYDLVQKLPIGDRDADLVKAVEAALGDLSCMSNHVRTGEVELFCPNPYESEPLEIHLLGATEENFMVGDLFETTAVFQPGSSICSLLPCENLPIGYLQFKATVEVQGMSMRYHLAFENFPLPLVPRPKATMDERKQQAFEFLARYGERNANRAVAILHAEGSRDEFEHILRRQIAFINRRSDCSDFYLPYLPHILNAFADHPYVTEDLKREMKQCLLDFRYWHDEPGDDAMWFYSENHALMFHVCQLIAGEQFPDEVFSNSGMTGLQMQQKAVGLLRPWFETFFAIGFTEWNSPPYLPIDALGFASLYAQTSNREMKALAKKAMDMVYYLLAVYSLDGIFCTTAGRTYPKELFGNNSNCPSFINWIGYGIGNTSHAGKGVTALCFSDYQAPQEYRQFCQVPQGKALISQSTHGYNGHADVYACKTSCSLLSSANNFRFGERGFQENPLHLIFSATEQLWINHPGEYNLFGHARPSYWAGNGTLPRVNQFENFASVVFNNDSKHPVDFTHVYLPIMEFASFQQRGNWLFVEARNGGYAAVYCSRLLERITYGPNKDREFAARGRQAVYLIRVGSRQVWATFEAFIRAMVSSNLAATDQAFVFEDACLGRLEGGWQDSLQVNGETVRYDSFDPVGINRWGDER